MRLMLARAVATTIALLPLLPATGSGCKWESPGQPRSVDLAPIAGVLTILLPESIADWRILLEPSPGRISASIYKAMPREKYCDIQVERVPYEIHDGAPDLRLRPDTLDLTTTSGFVRRLGVRLAAPPRQEIRVRRGSQQVAATVTSTPTVIGTPGPAATFVSDLQWPPPVRSHMLATRSLRALAVPERGGEIGSLAVLHQGLWRELLYRAMDYCPRAGWTGKAPFLWPATGRNFPKDVAPNEEARGSSYDWHGKRLPMPIHGFARDLPWRVEREARTGARYTLADSAATRRSYPFGFNLTVDYAVRLNTLVIAYTVTAASDNSEAMPFAAGNHITFRTPLVPGSDPVRNSFETPSTIEYLKGAGGVPTGETRTRSYASATPLSEIPANTAVSLGGYREEPYMVLRDPAGISVRIRHTSDRVPPDPVVRFNVWGDARNGYFSPEPWVGLQNSFNLEKGMIRLAPGQSWNWRIEISVETR